MKLNIRKIYLERELINIHIDIKILFYWIISIYQSEKVCPGVSLYATKRSFSLQNEIRNIQVFFKSILN
jgi:hypothetical protein